MSEFVIVDLSRHNGKPDFKKMAAKGVRVVITRATVGDYYTDDRLEANVFEAKEAGMLTGVYYVTAPADGSGRKISAEAHIDRFLRAIEGLPLDLPHTVDNELTRGVDRWRITALIQSCFSLTPWVNGKPPRNYTRQTWWEQNVLRSPVWKQYPLHAARYFNGSGPWSDGRYKFSDYDDWALHQYSADGNYLGEAYGVESKHIDLNRFNGTWQQFLAFSGLADPVDQAANPADGLTLEAKVELLLSVAREKGWPV